MYRILMVFMADKHLRNSRPTTPHNFSHAKPQAVKHFSLQMPRVNPRPVHRGFVVDKAALGQVFLQVFNFALSISSHLYSTLIFHSFTTN
jgi:hypothetical protein